MDLKSETESGQREYILRDPPRESSCLVFSKTWRTAYFRDRTLHRVTGTYRANHDSNFYDVETGEGYWISGPKRDQTDGRYSNRQPLVDDDARDAYTAFLGGQSLPGREQG